MENDKGTATRTGDQNKDGLRYKTKTQVVKIGAPK